MKTPSQECEGQNCSSSSARQRYWQAEVAAFEGAWWVVMIHDGLLSLLSHHQGGWSVGWMDPVPDLVAGNTGHTSSIGTGWSLRPIPTKPFYEPMTSLHSQCKHLCLISLRTHKLENTWKLYLSDSITLGFTEVNFLVIHRKLHGSILGRMKGGSDIYTAFISGTSLVARLRMENEPFGHFLRSSRTEFNIKSFTEQLQELHRAGPHRAAEIHEHKDPCWLQPPFSCSTAGATYPSAQN